MKIKLSSVVKFCIILGIFSVLFLLLLPVFLHVPPHYGPVRTPPGIPTVLRQVRLATLEYGIREGKEPRTLEDLAGITVRDSKGATIPFSVRALEQELGTNASAVRYFPEFSGLAFGTVPIDEIVLAYVPESGDPAFCRAIFRGGRMEQIRLSEVERIVERLRELLQEAGKK